MFSRTTLSFATRDRSFLIRGAAVIGLAAVVIAYGVGLVRDRVDPLEGRASEILPTRVETIEALGEALAEYREHPGKEEEASSIERQSYEMIQSWEDVDAPMRGLFNDYISLCGSLPNTVEGLAGGPHWQSLEMRCQREPVQQEAHRLTAGILLLLDEPTGAANLLREGFERTGDRFLLERAVGIALAHRDHDELRQVLDDPEKRDLLPARLLTRVALELPDYVELFRSGMLFELEAFRLSLALLSLLATVVWFSVLLQLGEGWGRWIPHLLALLLGVASAYLTLYVVYIQQDLRGFRENGDFANDLLVCIAGIGLREEVVKILCFLPLLPWVVLRDSRILALTVGGCVGLGFALQENMNYFDGAAHVAWGRFLTANFLHMATTGIAAHALYLLARAPKRNWENALIDLLTVVLAHGIYDAFLIVQQLQEYSLGSIFVLAFLAHRYFGILAEARTPRRVLLAPLGLFVLGSSVVLGISLSYMVWDLGFARAFSVWGQASVSVAPVVFLFINQLGD